jgi:hypothetical protein
MTHTAKAIPAHVDATEQTAFLDDYVNTPLPGGSVSTILTCAFRAFILAGVVVLDDGTAPEDVTIDVHGGRVMLIRNGQVHPTWWTPEGGLPSFDEPLKGLIDLLVTILQSSPWTGYLDWPHTRN